eukprot:CAMPEP_0202966926 /NCGR_PEP_ID=MMETSP1396-20130829/11590_1 /ASSEMBLY_ACC=CAM_ASM_000872 /TAXON_ID= /ORGANISM="Pseudokeronopsis sp., Strain Brazil" /LENGTH=32 /DNA_ID= /DNA_START= /DNA_END= /DNA_ORIENTATION=
MTESKVYFKSIEMSKSYKENKKAQKESISNEL